MEEPFTSSPSFSSSHVDDALRERRTHAADRAGAPCVMSSARHSSVAGAARWPLASALGGSAMSTDTYERSDTYEGSAWSGWIVFAGFVMLIDRRRRHHPGHRGPGEGRGLHRHRVGSPRHDRLHDVGMGPDHLGDRDGPRRGGALRRQGMGSLVRDRRAHHQRASARSPGSRPTRCGACSASGSGSRSCTRSRRAGRRRRLT